MAADKATGIDPKRMVVIFFVLAAIALGVFLEKILGLVFSYARWNDPAIFGEDWTLTTVLGFAIAAIAAVVIWRTPRDADGLARDRERAEEGDLADAPRDARGDGGGRHRDVRRGGDPRACFDYVWAKLSSLVY